MFVITEKAFSWLKALIGNLTVIVISSSFQALVDIYCMVHGDGECGYL